MFLTRMGFRGSRVELRPLRGLAPLDRLRRSPALRAGRVKSRRPNSSGEPKGSPFVWVASQLGGAFPAAGSGSSDMASFMT
jgi:hypothetical protein